MFRFLSIQSVQLTCQVRHHQEYCGFDHEHLGTFNKMSNSSLQTEVCIQFCAQGGGMMSDTYPSDKISSSFWFMTTRVRKFFQSTLKQNTGVVKMCCPCTRGRVCSQGWEDGKYLLLKDSLLFIKCCWTTVQLDMLLIQGILELKALRWGNWLGDWNNIGAIMIHHVISCSTVSCRYHVNHVDHVVPVARFPVGKTKVGPTELDQDPTKSVLRIHEARGRTPARLLWWTVRRGLKSLLSIVSWDQVTGWQHYFWRGSRWQLSGCCWLLYITWYICIHADMCRYLPPAAVVLGFSERPAERSRCHALKLTAILAFLKLARCWLELRRDLLHMLPQQCVFVA